MENEKIEGFLEVGHNDKGEVVINHPDLKPDENGVGHIVFSPAQARNLARLLLERADVAEKSWLIPPPDRSQRTMTDESQETPDHREINPVTGMQKGYVVLAEEERRKGFVRPLRDTYTHKTCGINTTMGRAIAETYARDPGFYSGTFCAGCKAHFPLEQFVWTGTDQIVGT